MAFVRTRARSNNNWWSGGWWRRVVGLHERVLLPHREEETIIIMGNEKTMIKWRKASVSLKWTLDLFLCRPCLQSGLGLANRLVVNEWMNGGLIVCFTVWLSLAALKGLSNLSLSPPSYFGLIIMIMFVNRETVCRPLDTYTWSRLQSERWRGHARNVTFLSSTSFRDSNSVHLLRLQTG